MSVCTEAEVRYLSGGRQLGRIATVDADGTPHVVPVAWIYNAARDTIDVGGHVLERSKKFRDVARTGRAAIVLDDLASTDPWVPRAIEVRGRGEAIALPTPLIRIYLGADHQLGDRTRAAARVRWRARQRPCQDFCARPGLTAARRRPRRRRPRMRRGCRGRWRSRSAAIATAGACDRAGGTG